MGSRFDSPGDVPRPPADDSDDAESGGSNATASDETTDGDGVRVLFDVDRPERVQLFRHAIAELEAGGHEALVASRDAATTTALLDAFDVDHVPLTERAGSLPGLAREGYRRARRLFAVARRFEPDVIVGRLAPQPVYVSKLVGCRNLVVCNALVDSRAMRTLKHLLTLPFVDTICVPDEYELSVRDEKRQHLAFQALASLHPRYFSPDPDVLVSHGIDPCESYFLLGLSVWADSGHAGRDGFSPSVARELAGVLDDHGSVYVSGDGDVPDDVPATSLSTPPEAAHHVLYYADLYVGDSGVTSAEAAMLGTPAVQANSRVETTDEMVDDALEDRYGLLQSVDDEADAIEAAKRLASNPPDERELRQARARLVAERADVTHELVDAILDGAAASDGRTVDAAATEGHARAERE